MKIKVLFLVWFVFAFGPIALAKDSASERADSKVVSVMPASMPSPAMQTAKDVKKSLDLADAAPTLKQEISKAADDLVKTVKDAIKLDSKMPPQKGDRKTDFSQSENKMHSPEHQPAPTDVLDLTQWTSSPPSVVGSSMNVYYYPPSTSPYNYIIVNYDSLTHQPLSATAYSQVQSMQMPDLTGMVQISSSTVSSGSGTTTIDTYALYSNTTPSLIVQLNYIYSKSGVFQTAYITTITNLSLDKVKVPVLP